MIGLGTTLGVELTADTARAVSSGGDRVAEVPFDPARPEPAVAALREAYGPVGAIALAVGYAHLHVTVPRLPPVAPAQRVAILALEPDRFFPIAGPAAVALGGDTAFAADGVAVERWVAAFAAWAPVAAVHAAPVAIAHAVRAEGTFVVPDAAAGETALVTLARGALAGARRAPAGVAVDATLLPAPRPGVAARLAAAAGAARAADAAVHEQLLTPALASRLGADRARRTATAALACLAALAFALWSVDQARERTLARTEAAVAALRDSAAAALALSDRVAALDGEMAAARAATSGGGTADPLAVLAALGARLPGDATVLSLTATGDAWRLEGRAANAAAVVPALDGAAPFADVHLAGPTARFTEGRRAYESFSVAFRVTP